MSGISQVIASANYEGSDIKFDANNDLLTVDGEELTEQRILRRLLTAPGTYIQHPTYGVGIQLYVGLPLSDDLYSNLKTTIISQMFEESTVSRTPEPTIELTTLGTQLYIQITYVPVGKNTPVILSFTFQK